MRKVWLTLSLVALVTSFTVSRAHAQKPPPPPPAPADETRPATVARKAPPPPPAAPTPDGRNRKVGPNVRVEVTFSEQRSDAPAMPKTVMVTTNDGQWGRVRSSISRVNYSDSPLNVDAAPEVLADGRILLKLNIEYVDKHVPEGKEAQSGQIIAATLSESVTLLMDSGKPLTATQSADPMSDRKVTVEVKATILKN